MKKHLLLLLIFIIGFFSLFGQSPYQLKTGRELALAGTGLGLVGTSYYFHNKLKPLNEQQIAELRAEGISPFERWVTTRRDVHSDNASDVFLYSSQLFPVALTLIDPQIRGDIFKVGNMYGQVLLINAGVTSLLKNTIHRTRPFVYENYATIDKKMSKGARTSFPSGHTSQTASMCFLTARLYADYHPGSKWKPVMWGLAATIPAATGILRMTAGKHFPSDVIVGYVIGASIGYFVPVLHRRVNQ